MKIQEYKDNWYENIRRMEPGPIVHRIMDYKPKESGMLESQEDVWKTPSDN
jgi:hypothetical protein